MSETNRMKAIYDAEKRSAESLARMMNNIAEAEMKRYRDNYDREAKERKDMIADLQKKGMSEGEAFRKALQLGFGPRIFNPPVRATTKYIVNG